MKLLTVLAGIALLAASVVGAAAQEAPPLVVRAKLNRPWTAEDGLPMLVAVSPGSKTPVFGTNVRIDLADLRAEFEGPGREDAGFVHLSFRGAAVPVSVVASLEHMKGDVDLGKIVLGDDAPVLVAGHVAAPDGKPAAGARVSVMASVGASSSWGVGTAVCGADGAFSLRGSVLGKGVRLKLEPTGSWGSDAPLAADPGTRDARLVAERRAGVSGVLDLPLGLGPRDLEVVVTGPRDFGHKCEVDGSGSWTSRGSSLRFECAERAFRIRGLRHGSYDFALRFRGAAKDLAVRKGIAVGEEPVEVPPLAVTERVRHVKVRVRDEKGAPLAGARLWAREIGDAGGWRELPADEGRATVATLGDEVSLAACGTDTDFAFATATLAGATLVPVVPAPRTVALKARPSSDPSRLERLSQGGAVVAMRWIGSAEALAPTEVDDLCLADPRMTVQSSSPLPATGRLEFRVAVPGWYRVSIRVGTARGHTETTLDDVRVDGSGDVSATMDLSVVGGDDGRRADPAADAGTGLKGTLELPAGLDPDDLELVVVGPPNGLRGADTSGSFVRSTAESLSFSASRQFGVTCLGPGEYEVRLKFRGSSRWLTRARDVAVKAGAVTDLGPLRVEEPIRRATVRVALPEGTAPGSLKVWARNAGDRGDFREVRVPAEGPVLVSFAGESVSIGARAAGTTFALASTSGPECTLALTAAAGAPVTIRLPPGTSRRVRESGAFVRLDWCGPPETPEERVVAVEDDKDPRRSATVDVPLPAEGDVLTTLDEPGWYRISFGVRRGRRSVWSPCGTRFLVKAGTAAARDLGRTAEDIERQIDDL